MAVGNPYLPGWRLFCGERCRRKGIDANLLNGKDGPRRVGVGGDLIPGLERRLECIAAGRRRERNREARQSGDGTMNSHG